MSDAETPTTSAEGTAPAAAATEKKSNYKPRREGVPSLTQTLKGVTLEDAQRRIREAFIGQDPNSKGNYASDVRHWGIVHPRLPAFTDTEVEVDGKKKTLSVPNGPDKEQAVNVTWAARVLSDLASNEFITFEALTVFYRMGFKIERDNEVQEPLVLAGKTVNATPRQRAAAPASDGAESPSEKRNGSRRGKASQEPTINLTGAAAPEAVAA